MSKVILRPFQLLLDAGLIYSSYPKGVYHGSYEPITQDKSEWFKAFYATVKRQLETLENRHNITIACMEDDPNAILGYIIVENDVLQFLYVKELIRNQGIATLLAKQYKIKDVANLTKVGHAILSKHKPSKEGSNNEPESI